MAHLDEMPDMNDCNGPDMTVMAVEGRRIARQGFAVRSGETVVGEVTSGTLSPTLGKSIAMAFVASEHAAEGTSLEVDLGSSRVGAVIVPLPFYKRPKA